MGEYLNNWEMVSRKTLYAPLTTALPLWWDKRGEEREKREGWGYAESLATVKHDTKKTVFHPVSQSALVQRRCRGILKLAPIGSGQHLLQWTLHVMCKVWFKTGSKSRPLSFCCYVGQSFRRRTTAMYNLRTNMRVILILPINSLSSKRKIISLKISNYLITETISRQQLRDGWWCSKRDISAKWAKKSRRKKQMTKQYWYNRVFHHDVLPPHGKMCLLDPRL